MPNLGLQAGDFAPDPAVELVCRRTPYPVPVPFPAARVAKDFCVTLLQYVHSTNGVAAASVLHFILFYNFGVRQVTVVFPNAVRSLYGRQVERGTSRRPNPGPAYNLNHRLSGTFTHAPLAGGLPTACELRWGLRAPVVVAGGGVYVCVFVGGCSWVWVWVWVGVGVGVSGSTLPMICAYLRFVLLDPPLCPKSPPPQAPLTTAASLNGSLYSTTLSDPPSRPRPGRSTALATPS